MEYPHEYNGNFYNEDEWFCYIHNIKICNVDPIGTYKTENDIKHYYDLKDATLQPCTYIKVGNKMIKKDVVFVLTKDDAEHLQWILINRSQINP